MEKILYFLWEWRFVIAVAAAFLLFCLFEWQKAKTVLYALMLQAKRLAKDMVLKSGQEQEDWVVRKAMQFLPPITRVILSEGIVRQIVKWLFDKAKDYLDDGLFNRSI